MTLTETQNRGLIELEAACDESIKYGGDGWIGTSRLCGTSSERSAKNMRSLVALDLAEGHKYGVTPQGQWVFRITETGRRYLSDEQKVLDQ